MAKVQIFFCLGALSAAAAWSVPRGPALAPATDAIRATLGAVDPRRLTDATVGGDTVARVSTQASGNGASIGGVKVETERGWFAARPSGTEPIYKIYAESFEDTAHLDLLIADAQDLIATL